MITRNQLKIIKSLKLKKNRISEGLFTVEGLKNIKELMESDFSIKDLFVTEEYQHFFQRQPFSIIKKKDLQSVSSFSNNETCLAVVQQKDNHDILLDEKAHTLVLDGVSDPGNLGTIIRTMDWFGWTNLICSNDCADFYNSKTISSTMGSFTRILPLYTNLKEFLSKNSRPTYGMTLDGKPISDTTFPQYCNFVLGSESHGIRPDIADLIQYPISIKGSGQAESLNVAIANSILLYHISLL